MLTQDKDEEEELVLFMEMHLHEKGHRADNNTMSSQGYTHRRTAADNFLYSEIEKSDYDWLVSPPGSPKTMSFESNSGTERPSSSYSLRSTSRPSTPTRRPSSSGTSRANSTSARASSSTRRPSSSGTSRATVTGAHATLIPSSNNSSRSTSRASTPTRRPSSSGSSSVTLTSTRATTTGQQTTSLATSIRSNNRPMTTPNTKSGSRSGTPTRRLSTPTGSSIELKSKPTKPTHQIIDSTSSTRSNNRPMTTPSTKPGSRSNTPTRRPSTPTGSSTELKSKPTKTVSKPSHQIIGSATSTRTNNRPMTAYDTKPGSRSGTPTRRPSTPTGSSTDLKSNSTKPMSKPVHQIIDSTTSTRSNNRPMTAPNTPTRRPPTPTGSSKSKPTKPIPSPILRSRPWEPYEMPGFSLEAPSNLRTTLSDRPQTASSSSSRETKAFGGASSGSSSRSTSIERVVPRRQSCSPSRNRAPIGNVNGAGHAMKQGKTSNKDDGRSNSRSNGSGFGRNLSQSSIDMALRHLNIKRENMTGNFRPSVTKIPATSLYSTRSSGTKQNRPTSSSGSSDSSINILCLDGNIDNVSERSYSSIE